VLLLSQQYRHSWRSKRYLGLNDIETFFSIVKKGFKLPKKYSLEVAWGFAPYPTSLLKKARRKLLFVATPQRKISIGD
jgi:hypothetical protein